MFQNMSEAAMKWTMSFCDFSWSKLCIYHLCLVYQWCTFVGSLRTRTFIFSGWISTPLFPCAFYASLNMQHTWLDLYFLSNLSVILSLDFAVNEDWTSWVSQHSHAQWNPFLLSLHISNFNIRKLFYQEKI